MHNPEHVGHQFRANADIFYEKSEIVAAINRNVK